MLELTLDIVENPSEYNLKLVLGILGPSVSVDSTSLRSCGVVVYTIERNLSVKWTRAVQTRVI